MAEDANNNGIKNSNSKVEFDFRTAVVMLSFLTSVVAVYIFYFNGATNTLVWNTITIVNKKSGDFFRETSEFPTIPFSNQKETLQVRIRVVQSQPPTSCESLRGSLKPEIYSLNDAEKTRYESEIKWVLLAESSLCDVDTKIINAQTAGFDHLLVYNANGDLDHSMAFNASKQESFLIDISFIPKDDAIMLQRNYPKTQYTLWMNRKLTYMEIGYNIYISCFTHIENFQAYIYDSFISAILYLPRRIFKTVTVEVQVLSVVGALVAVFTLIAVTVERGRRARETANEELRRAEAEEQRERDEDAKRQKEEEQAKRVSDEINSSRILEISVYSSAEAIKEAYKRLSLLRHPDKAPKGLEKEFTVKFQELQQAYTTLLKFREEEDKVKKERERREEESRRRREDEARRKRKEEEEDEEERRQQQREEDAEKANTKDERKFSKILGIPPNSTAEVITKAYKNLSLVWHPDKVQGEAKKREHTTEFQKINNAYETLLKFRGK